MVLYQYNDLLILLRVITNIVIPLLFIILYKTSKDKKLLFFILIFTLEIMAIQLKIYNINFTLKSINEIYITCVIIKLFFIFIIKQKSESNIIKYALPVLFTLALIYIETKTSFMGSRIYEIIINIYIINLICTNNIYVKYHDNQLNKNKLSMNKKDISKKIDEIEKESIINTYMNENIKSVNDKLASIVEVIDIPIIIIKKSTYECIFKNRYFDQFILENNLQSEKFNSEEFIRNILHIDPDDDFLCNEGNLNDQKRNFIKIDFLNKKYDVAVVKDYYNEEEMLIFEIKDVTDISIEEEKLKKSELRYKTLMDILSDGIIIHDGTNVSYMNKIAMDMLKLN